MATLKELLEDRSKSDDMKITVEGAETTLGELRKGFSLQSDYTRKTTELSEARREFTRMREGFESDKAQWELARADAEAKLAEFAKQIVQSKPGIGTDEVAEEMAASPVARRLVQELTEVRNQLANLDKANKDQAEYLRKLELTRFEDQHREMLRKLKAEDPELDEDELISYAQKKFIPRLDVAYRDKMFEQRIAAARAEGEKAGMEKGMVRMKKELSQPLLPPRRVLSPVPDAPKDWNQAVDAALGDPEIMNVFQGLDNP